MLNSIGVRTISDVKAVKVTTAFLKLDAIIPIDEKWAPNLASGGFNAFKGAMEWPATMKLRVVFRTQNTLEKINVTLGYSLLEPKQGWKR